LLYNAINATHITFNIRSFNDNLIFRLIT